MRIPGISYTMEGIAAFSLLCLIALFYLALGPLAPATPPPAPQGALIQQQIPVAPPVPATPTITEDQTTTSETMPATQDQKPEPQALDSVPSATEPAPLEETAPENNGAAPEDSLRQ